MMDDLVHAAKRGAVTLAEPAQYPLADAAKVHAALESRATSGAMVLIP
jgi:NADPH2:quinone reductase